MALGYLFILFIVFAVISGLGSVFLILSKNPKFKASLFYFMAIWAMLIAFLSATSLPSNYVTSQIISWGIGFLAVVAIPLKIKGTSPKAQLIAQILVIASTLLGLYRLFFW